MVLAFAVRPLPWLAVVVLSGIVPPRVVHAQRVLDKPQVELSEPFTNVGSVRELSDGRVLVVDNGDRALYVVDFRAGTSSQIGRPGSGPAEYRVPGLLLAAGGDTTLLTDAGNNRLLAIGPDARPLDVLANAWPLLTGAPGTRMPRGYDASGRGYFLKSAVSGGSTTEIRQADSTAIVRAARGSSADETVGYIRLARRDISAATKDGKITSIDVRIPPFPAQDGWQVFADGAVAMVRVRDYRVDWLLPDGRRVAGPPIPFAPVRVTEQDKQIRESGARGSSAVPAGGAAPNKPAPLDYPELKPPFPYTGVLAGADGRLWVQRHTPAQDTRTHYDVIDRRGSVTSKIVVPNAGRIVGFGARSIYVVRTDADDLQYLQRFALQ